MKVAICLSGEARNFDDPYITQKFNEHLSADVFISTWSHSGGSYNCGEQHGVLEPRDAEPGLAGRLASHYPNVKAIEVEDYSQWLAKLSSEVREIMSTKVSFAVTAPPQLYKIYRCNQLKREYEKLHGRYDCVMRARFDLVFLQKPPLDDLNAVNHVNFGISGAYWAQRVHDTFFYSSSENMDRLTDTWTHIEENVNHPLENSLEKVDCCRLLYITCLKHNIRVRDLQEPVCGVYRGQGETEFLQNMQYCYGSNR